MSLRTAERPKTRPRPRRAETSSPPRRSNTRKVNVVSQASLAMLNPAYAMGIEAGPSWQEEEEARWRADRARRDGQGLTHPSIAPASSPRIKVETRSPWSMSPTPELEAFLTDEPFEHLMAQQDNDDIGGDALGLTLHSTDMSRKQSSESVFEDEEPSPAKRRPNASSSSSSLTRFFTWKRSPRNKNATSQAPPPWDPQTAPPPQIQYFDRPSLDTLSRKGVSSSSSTTPVDVFTKPLPSTDSLSKVLTRTMSRKSSMPTLRDIRRAAANTSSHDIPLPEMKGIDTVSSFYWRSNDEPKTPTMASSSGTLTPSSSSSTSLSGRLTPQGSSHRISSLGRGLASPRKSTVEVPMTTEYSDATSPTKNVAVKKKGPQLYSSRNDPWSLQNMPPLPTNISIASLVAAEEEEEEQSRLQETASSSECSSGSSTATVIPRRRSQSVGAILNNVASLPLLSLTSNVEAVDEGEVTTQQAIRAHVNNRSIIGTASPKLLLRETPSPISRIHSTALLNVTEPTVVVNVMPPTPDLGASEQETFESSSVSTCEQRQEVEVTKCQREEELTSLVEEHCVITSGVGRDDSKTYQREDDYCSLQRSDSVRSDISQSTVASADTNMSDNMDEPFGFARSMSTMSLCSDSSSESDSTCSHDTEEGEEDRDDCKEAQIMSASSTISSFSRAHFVSPRMRELSGWSNHHLAESNSGSISSSPSAKSFKSLPPSTDASPTCKRKSKRLSSVAGQNLANVMTTTTENDSKAGPVEYRSGQDDLSSPVELQSQVDETDCDTPRLSGGPTMAGPLINLTKPLNVKKTTMEKQESPITTILSPPRLYSRAHNAESPHLELDLSLPLDLHDIGPIVESRESSLHRERPRVPQKSRARTTMTTMTTMANHRANSTGEPKTPPSGTRLLESVMQEGRHRESFGLGLGLGLGLENAIENPMVTKNSSPPTAPSQLWQRPRKALLATRHVPNTTYSPSHIGFAI